MLLTDDTYNTIEHASSFAQMTDLRIEDFCLKKNPNIFLSLSLCLLQLQEERERERELRGLQFWSMSTYSMR